MLALQALCVYDGIGDEFAASLDAFLHDSHVHVDLGLPSAPGPETLAFAAALTRGVRRERDRLDEILRVTAVRWSIARMTPVDRNLLRLGVYELLEEPDTPPQVIINEAVDLASRFGDTDSAAFVNGLLDAIRRERLVDPPSAGAAPERADAGGPDGPV